MRTRLEALYHEDRLIILRKDLRLELRTLETVPAMVLFPGHLRDLPFRPQPRRDRRPARRRRAHRDAAVRRLLGINRLFVAEREQGGFDAFLLAPVDRTALLVAKAAALFLFLAALEVIALPAFAPVPARPVPGTRAAGADPRARCWPISGWP